MEMIVQAFGASSGSGTSDKGKGSPYSFSSLSVLIPRTDFKNAHADFKACGSRESALPLSKEAWEKVQKLPWKDGVVLPVKVQTEALMGNSGKLESVVVDVMLVK